MWASYVEALHEREALSRTKGEWATVPRYRPKPTTSATTRCRSRIALPSIGTYCRSHSSSMKATMPSILYTPARFRSPSALFDPLWGREANDAVSSAVSKGARIVADYRGFKTL